MSDWNLGRVFRVAAAAVYVYFNPAQWQVLAAQLAREHGSVQRNKQRRRAIQKYNDSLQSRIEMLDLQPNAPRSIVLGRVRHVEGVRDRWTSGSNEERLTMIVSFAGHEIDAFEQFYLNDLPVTLDANGWVQEAPYGRTDVQSYDVAGTLDGSGAAVTVLPEVPTATPVAIWYTGSGVDRIEGACSVSMSGATATITGGQAGAAYTLTYSGGVLRKFVRIRPYLGTATQDLYADLSSEYPGKLASGDAFKGLALAVVDVIYDPDAFPQGRPNVSAVMRGAKCLDPRTGTTAWTRNPALHAYHYARHANGLALSAGNIRTADIEDAADACDVSTVFTLRKSDGSTSTVTLPRYQCDLVIPTDADPGEVMDTIVQTMAGRRAWAGPLLRLRAGTLNATATTITQDWLVSSTGSSGAVDQEPVISAVQSIRAVERWNRVSGSCVDPAQRYQVLPFPAVSDSVLIAAKGLRSLEVEFPGVAHIAHAQHLASIIIREAQAGLKLEVTLDERAADLEVLDVVALDMAEYGYSAKTFEVVGWQWQPDGPYTVRLAEITAEMFEPLAELTGRDPAPDSTIREPWDVEQLEGLAVTSGTTPTLDGSIITRATVTWDAAAGETIRKGGQVEIQYTPASDETPGGDWPVWMEAGTATTAQIPGLLAGRYYLFRARFVQPLPLVRGAWSAVVSHKIGSATQDTLQSSLADALATAAAAQATADGKIESFYQASAPGSANEGDLWFDTDDGLKQYRYTSGAWVLAADTRIGQAINDAADAQATADGKVTTFVATSAPTADAVGDLWLDSDDGNKLYRWNGSAWVALPVGTGAIAPSAATVVVSDSGTISHSFTATPGFPYRVQRFRQISWTNSTGADVTVELSAEIGGSRSAGAGSVWLDAASQTSTLTSGDFSGLAAEDLHTEATTAYRRYTHTDHLVVASGATIYFALTAYINTASGTTTDFSGSGRLRITAVLR